MKKTLFLLLCISLLASCDDEEKFNEWQNFDIVPGTSICESAMGVSLSYDELMMVVKDVCYELTGRYYCKSGKKGTSYRLQTEESYNVVDMPTYATYAENYYIVRREYVEFVSAASDEAICYIAPYVFDELSMTLKGFPLDGVDITTLMYVDNENLILQSNYVDPNNGTSDDAEFTRYVFSRREALDLSAYVVDTLDYRFNNLD